MYGGTGYTHAYSFPPLLQSPLPVPVTHASIYAAQVYGTPLSESGNKRARVNQGAAQNAYAALYGNFATADYAPTQQVNTPAYLHAYPPRTAYATVQRPAPVPALRTVPDTPASFPKPYLHDQPPLRPKGPQPPSQPPPPELSAAALKPNPSEGPYFTTLHDEILALVDRLSLTPAETRERQDIVAAITQSVREAFAPRSAHLQPFGSFASGLSLHSSDLDLVITGLMEPDKALGYYQQYEKGIVSNHLSQLSRALYRNRALYTERQFIIRNARIPIIKLRTTSGVDVDISLGGDYGLSAARWAREQCQHWPQMRPLVLVVKALLAAQGLNDTATGGLSSYSVTNMVVAHLQVERRKGPLPGLGKLLHSFLDRFGRTFDYSTDAIAVAHGGIVRQSALGMESPAYGLRLMLKCPLSGREVAGGTYRLDMVQDAFRRAASAIDGAVQQYKAPSRGPSAAVPGVGAERAGAEEEGGLLLLDAILDVDQVTGRRSSGGVDAAGARALASLQLGKRSRDLEDD